MTNSPEEIIFNNVVTTLQSDMQDKETINTFLKHVSIFQGYEQMLDSHLKIVIIPRNTMINTHKYVYIGLESGRIVLKTHDFLNISQSHQIYFNRSIYERIISIRELNAKISYFYQFPFFQGMTLKSLGDLVKNIPERHFTYGQKISTIIPNKIGLIKRGSIILSQTTQKSNKPISIITTNDIFGEPEYLREYFKKEEIIQNYDAICYSESAEIYVLNISEIYSQINKSAFNQFVYMKYQSRIQKLQKIPQIRAKQPTEMKRQNQCEAYTKYEKDIDQLRINESEAIKKLQVICSQMGQSYQRVKIYFEQKRLAHRPFYQAFMNQSPTNKTQSNQKSFENSIKLRKCASTTRHKTKLSETFSNSFCKKYTINKRTKRELSIDLDTS